MIKKICINLISIFYNSLFWRSETSPINVKQKPKKSYRKPKSKSPKKPEKLEKSTQFVKPL